MSSSNGDALVLLGGKRTAMAEYSGSRGYGLLKDITANDLGAHAAKATLEATGVSPEAIDQVFIGNALQTSACALYGARHVALKAGIPIERPAMTVNRLCGSGIQSVVSAAHAIRMGEAKTCLAGGMENMSQAPHIIRGGRDGFRFGAKIEVEDLLMASLYDPYCKLFMAQTAEKVAGQYAVTREDQDAFALRSHRLGAAAVEAGHFAEEIAPITVRQGKQEVVVDKDDHIKPDTNAEALARLRPAFGKEGTVTAGNASGIVDGAAALVMTTRSEAERQGWRPRAEVVAWSVVGVPPEIMGIGPAPAIRAVLGRAGLSLGDIDLFEINEAFAAQFLAVEKDLGLDREKVNVNGGAIALGHPLGATGARLLLTLLMELERRKATYGIASACIGGGQGIAMLLRRAS